MIDVVIPVCGDRERAAQTLATARAATGRRFRALVIDEPHPGTGSGELFPQAVVFVNRTRRGFAGAANRGLRMSRGDVVVLAPGTRVGEGWLESLEESSRSRPRVASVTPVTTRGGFASPETSPSCGVALEAAARRFAATASPRRPEIPLALPFCLFLRREALEAVGPFDELHFPEARDAGVDLSLRAARRGFRHLLDDRVLVAPEVATGDGLPGVMAAVRDPGSALGRREPLLADLLAAFHATGDLDDVAARARRVMRADGIRSEAG